MTDTPMPSCDLLALAEARVPRYTSYPTAAQFGALEEATYREWLQRGIGAADPLSLYLHVPFCRDLCWYCACHAKPTRSDARVTAYGAALRAELELLAAALPAHGGISHLHFGGGTPSILKAEGLGLLLAAIRARIGIRPGAELAIELDPRLMDEALVEGLGALGFNRASLGVQDIAPEVQARIGRPQPAEMVRVGVERLRRVGITGINLDLMYGLPAQTVAHVEASARFAAELRVPRIAVFGYAHVAWMKPHQKAIDSSLLPDASARMGQADAAEAVLRAAGYVALGLDHFALPQDPLAVAADEGRLRRNFQGYTTDTAPALLGLGASSIGVLRGGFAQNIADERRYAETVAAGRLPVARGIATTEEDRLRAGLIERLMCDFALDLCAVPDAMLVDAMARLGPLERDGLVRLDGAHLLVPPARRRFVRQVAACFDAYWRPAAQRHSAAV
ncbi:oxygen-independent coproporphyrinogen III oxidase [Teichococcus wenyumeiae]|nr:oxygen-independent coproporphyrinogen III oxidase [Pseudoroseomonas wenyumeiae]